MVKKSQSPRKEKNGKEKGKYPYLLAKYTNNKIAPPINSISSRLPSCLFLTLRLIMDMRAMRKERTVIRMMIPAEAPVTSTIFCDFATLGNNTRKAIVRMELNNPVRTPPNTSFTTEIFFAKLFTLRTVLLTTSHRATNISPVTASSAYFPKNCSKLSCKNKDAMKIAVSIQQEMMTDRASTLFCAEGWVAFLIAMTEFLAKIAKTLAQ